MEGISLRLRKSISSIEKIGNKLPHPFWIFTNLSLLMIILSYILSEKSFRYLQYGNMGVVKIHNLLEINYILKLIKDLPEIFAHFKPLPIVILILMGVSVFQESGAISALIRATLKRTPTKYLIAVVALIGVNSNIASDAAVIIVPAISGALFQSLGLHPWLGIIVGYASANGGFTLNMLIAGTDAIISGITLSVAENIGFQQSVNTFSNWYFMVVASILIVSLTILISERITKKILNQSEKYLITFTIEEIRNLSIKEKAGLRSLFVSNIVYFFVIFSIGRYYFNKDLSTLSTLDFFSKHIVGLIFLYFVISGVTFGLRAGTIDGIKELPKLFGTGIVGAKSFIITALPASVFIKILYDSNLGFWVANTISNILISINLHPLLLLILFIVLIAGLNLFITSGSVKWLFIAPLAIPIFTNLNFSPDIIQLSYRIGDTCTNIISPTEYYLPIIISLFESYKTDSDINVGIGTVVSLTIPYALAYLLGLIVLFLSWYFLGLPLGP